MRIQLCWEEEAADAGERKPLSALPDGNILPFDKMVPGRKKLRPDAWRPAGLDEIVHCFVQTLFHIL